MTPKKSNTSWLADKLEPIIDQSLLLVAFILVILTLTAYAIWPASLWISVVVWSCYTLLLDLPWHNRWSDWLERLIGLVLLILTGWLTLLSVQHLPFWQSAILWIAYAGALAFASWQGWYKLFGPVLFYDMVRTARRSRYLIIRLIYGGFLLIILCYLYLVLLVTTNFANVFNPNQPVNQGLQLREMAMMSEGFFATLMLIQLTIVVLLTPAYVAGAISDEKDRKTMEFILATDLRDREIIFSKYFSRLGNMTLLLLTGLPVLSILQFIGGIDLELMFAGFSAIGLTMLGIGSVSILLSTLFKRPRDAISLTYLVMIAYAAVSLLLLVLAQAPFWWMRVPLWFNENPPTPQTISNILNAGNPITAIIDVSMAIGGRTRTGARTTLAAELPALLQRYAWFHLTLTAVCLTWSIARLRLVALKQTTAGTTAQASWWQRLRPAVGNFPMIWKELYVEGSTKLNWLLWIAVVVLVLITLGSGVFVLGVCLWEIFMEGRDRMWAEIPQAMNIWFRFAGTFVGCLLLLMVGIRASTSITHERERDTLDALITTPMSAEGMLFAKLVGNLTSLRIGWIWFGSLLALALFTGGLHPLAVPIIVSACIVYAVFVTMIGLGFSIFCKSSLQSAVMTVLTILFLGGAHWIVTSCCLMPLFGGLLALVFNQGRNPEIARIIEKTGEHFIKFQAGITPPFVLAFCSFGWDAFRRNNGMRGEDFFQFIGFSILGLFLFAVMSAVLWFALLVPMFRRLSRRVEIL